MAWNARWTLNFDSRKGKQCVVTISEQGYMGNVTALTGGSSPFETQEDDDDDIFMPIRGHSGYIRIVTDDSTLLDSIVPSNELAHLVTLTVDGVVKWRGFQETEMFEQEWYEGNHEVELPVRSLLASLESTQLGNDKRYGLHSLGELFYDLFNSFGIADLKFRCMWNINTLHDYFSLQIYSGIFFNESSEDGELLDDRMYSDSGSDIAEALCIAFGIQLRESQGNIYFVQSGKWMALSEAFTLTDMKRATNKNYINGANPTLTEWIEQWRGTENQESRLKAYRGIDITLDIIKRDDSIELLRLADILEEDKPVYDMSFMRGSVSLGTLHIQPYPLTQAQEMYGDNNPWVRGYVYAFHNLKISLPVETGQAWCTEVVNNAPWRVLWDGASTSLDEDTPRNLYAGASPCRWSFDTGDSSMSNISTTEGYFLSLVPVPASRIPAIVQNKVFNFYTKGEETFEGGYIGIDFNLLGIKEGEYVYHPSASPSNKSWYKWKNDLKLMKQGLSAVYIALQVGNYYWNGSTWQTQIISFPVNIENGSVKGNYESTMGIKQAGGYLVPLGNITSGVVQVGICAMMIPSNSNDLYVGRGYFMNNFSVKYHKPSDDTSMLSDRSENTYRSLTKARGYNEVKDVTLKVGTNNYNRDSDSFLRDSQGAYIEVMRYLAGNGERRPEEELLARMKDYYSRSRKTYTATAEVKPIISDTRERGLPEIYPQIGNRIFIALDVDHDWREDTQKIKFIEVYRN